MTFRCCPTGQPVFLRAIVGVHVLDFEYELLGLVPRGWGA